MERGSLRSPMDQVRGRVAARRWEELQREALIHADGLAAGAVPLRRCRASVC